MATIWIDSISLSDLLHHKDYPFSKGRNLVFSEKNSVGKTTLLRLCLYAFGFPIPETSGFAFKDIDITLVYFIDGISHSIHRRSNRIYYYSAAGADPIKFSVPAQENECLSKVFGLQSPLLVRNLLGLMYFEQDEGWNRIDNGPVVGTIDFSADSILYSLSGQDPTSIDRQISVLNNNLGQCKQLLKLAKIQNTIGIQNKDTSSLKSGLASVNEELSLCFSKKAQLEQDIEAIEKSLRDRNGIISYLESMDLNVTDPESGRVVPINEKTLLEASDLGELLTARKAVLFRNMAANDLDISRLNQEKERCLLNAGFLDKDQQAIAQLSTININQGNIAAMAEAYRKQIMTLKGKKKNETETLKNIQSFFQEQMFDTARFFEIPEKYVRKLADGSLYVAKRGLSGALLHLISFSYRTSLILTADHFTKLRLPLFIDSPNSKELTSEASNKIFKFCSEHLSEHQVIVATISLPGKSLFELDGEPITLIKSVLEG